ncbi:hypothetical protein H6P81_018541 [Aristolochia fimbriata]|uniref:CRAL-TRIO domain-containing protein n=1 Tax=Aristolochia fimbriata TaxID=158543 RepID=A0AAV7E1N5_ARIFI|nr:hypothetical protein H6P81_018541 [Aristolochia fimbriata]
MTSAANAKKKQRFGSTTRLSSFPDVDLPSSPEEGTLAGLLRSVPGAFNDSLTADVILRLCPETSPSDDSDCDPPTDQSFVVDLHLHSHALRRSKFFAALLSDRWTLGPEPDGLFRLNLKIPPSPGSMEPHLTVLHLLYSNDFSDVILSVSVALSILPVALVLLFDDCIKACVQFLEAVPWSEDEEKAVLNIIPSLGIEESQELLTRVSPPGSHSSEEMLHKLITASIGNLPCVSSAKVKAFAAKMIRDFPSRESVRRVFDRAFDASLKTVKKALEEYSSPDFRGNHDETEAIQRINLHHAVYHGKNLLWLVERMIELRVADTAVKQWSDQTAFVADLQRAFQDDAWRNIAPGLPALVLRCTARFADAVAAGSLLAARQVRLKLVSVWLPVLIVCREKNVSPISSDAELLLHHCLSFATRNVEDCPHLIVIVHTMFKRKHNAYGCLENDSAYQEVKINELRDGIGPLSGHSLRYCDNACLRRYLEARNWNVDKSRKMLEETLKWRSTYKPEEIRWHEVASEGETGKVYRASFCDRRGRTILILRPGKQNTSSHDNQLRHLVYLIENAILNLAEGQEQMVWMIDFSGWSLSNSVPIKTARETANILQNHYPERLALAFLYNPPRIFEAFWKIVKYFLDPKTFQKVKFVYQKNEESMELIKQTFDVEVLPSDFGGGCSLHYDHEEFSRLMAKDDVKAATVWGSGERT